MVPVVVDGVGTRQGQTGQTSTRDALHAACDNTMFERVVIDVHKTICYVFYSKSTTNRIFQSTRNVMLNVMCNVSTQSF